MSHQCSLLPNSPTSGPAHRNFIGINKYYTLQHVLRWTNNEDSRRRGDARR